MGSLDHLDLTKHRLKIAENKLKSAQVLLEKGFYSDEQSRAYFCLLHCARALLATKKLDSRKHSGVISLFNQNFVKTGIVPRTYGKILMRAKDLREESDYDEFHVTSEEETKELLKQADQFLEGIKQALRKLAVTIDRDV